MLDDSRTEAIAFDYVDVDQSVSADKQEILRGLKNQPKTIHPKYFYDTRGSELFEQITRQPEYYPTSTELEILQQYANDIANICGTESVVVEPGSGNSEKIRHLLDALKPRQYVPIDIAGEFLSTAALNLAREFQWLDVLAISADFHRLNSLPDTLANGPKLIFYPGSTIGNMQPSEARQFLRKLRSWLNDNDRGLLIGIDLHKSNEVLEPAYNDDKGVTAEFNKNILENVNSITGGDFNTAEFDHRAIYNRQEQRIEMYLDTRSSHAVTVNEEIIKLQKGESILTEYSYKYTLDDIRALASDSGFELATTWLDAKELFSVSFLKPA